MIFFSFRQEQVKEESLRSLFPSSGNFPSYEDVCYYICEKVNSEYFCFPNCYYYNQEQTLYIFNKNSESKFFKQQLQF